MLPREIFRGSIDLCGFVEKRLLGEFAVESVQLQKFFMAALFNDFSLVQHVDAVRVFDCGKSVRDHENGPVFHQAIESSLDEMLSFGVDAGSGFI